MAPKCGGGYVRSQVVVSSKTIDSPMCETPDYLLALSLGAYNRFAHTVHPEGLIIYDPAFVEEIDSDLPCQQMTFSVKQLAMDHFNRAIFSNSIALGGMAKLLEELIDKEIILESLLEVIPKFHEQNKEAFALGYNTLAN